MKLYKENLTPEATPILQKENVPFRQLNMQQKAHFIWDYYKWWIICTIAAIVILVNVIPNIIENKKPASLYAVFVNTQLYGNDSTPIMDNFVKYSNIDMHNKRIVLDTTMVINRDKVDKFSMESNQKLLALLSSKTVDVVVCDKDNFDFYATQGIFQPLDKVLPKELYEKLKQYLVESNNSLSDGNDSKEYYGISLKDSKVLQDEKAYIVEPILGICINAKQPENAAKFVDYLLSELQPGQSIEPIVTH